MLFELASCIAKEIECGADVTEAENRLVCDTGGSVNDLVAATTASGNSGEIAWGAGIVISNKVAVEPTIVTIEGRAKRTDRVVTE